MARDVRDANPIQVIDCRAQADSVGNVSRAGFKALRRRLVERLLKGHVLDHVSAALPGGHVVQHFRLSIDHTNAGGRKYLVS